MPATLDDEGTVRWMRTTIELAANRLDYQAGVPGASVLDANRGGLDLHLGFRYETVAERRVVATLAVTEAHLQPYGLVHGGVYAAMLESVCSVGAALRELARGYTAVGIENTTRFIRGARVGARLRAEAVPAVEPADDRARWEATITNAAGEVCATGRLVVAILASDATVAGAAIGLPRVEVPDTKQNPPKQTPTKLF